MGIWWRLRARAAAGEDIAVAIVGAGYVGAGLAHRLVRTPGTRPALIVNRRPSRAVDAYRLAGVDPSTVVVAEDVDTLRAALGERRPVVTADLAALEEPGIDVVVEATGALDMGAEAILVALRAGHHVISINAEVDATLGWLLHDTAARYGAVYTISDGDQPGGMLRTLEWVDGMGFDVVAAVNCKRHLDRHQNAASSRAYAERDGTSVAVTVSAGDGTKMQIECAVVANTTGLVPDRRGMHGVPTTLEHAVADVLAVESRDGVVEYTLGGDFGAGVFVIGRTQDHDAVDRAMRFYKMGEGPDYLFFRPHTLVQFEMPETIAQVVLDGHGLGSPAAPPVAEIVAVAKRDLVPGEALDGIGGDLSYGEIDTVGGAAGFLPIAFTEHARVVRAVPADHPIGLDDVEVDASAPIVRLRAQQDELVSGVRT